MIPFNQPYNTGKELTYIKNAIESTKYIKKCETFLEKKYNFNKTLLTTSCTTALDMCALLLNISKGDEIIIPSYTYVSTANAFAKQGAKIIFADSKTNSPNIDEDKIGNLITSKTKAIIIVHYAGISVNIDKIQSIAKKYKLYIIEDAAQSINSFYKNKPLGSFGNLSAISFHNTKNIQCNEGGLLIINDKTLEKRAEIIYQNGTNKSAFLKGEVNKYQWLDFGSSYSPTQITAAYLYAQLEAIDQIQEKRLTIWNYYYNKLLFLNKDNYISLPEIPDFATNNAHIFYFTCKSEEIRNKLIEHLNNNDITASFHYLALHKSPFYLKNNKLLNLPNSEKFEKTIIRLPLSPYLTNLQLQKITKCIMSFFYK